MVPTFDKFLYPVLNALNDGKEHTLKSLMDDMALIFSLSDTDVAEKMLTKLMIENNIGVSLKQSYEIKRIDTDFFNEE